MNKKNILIAFLASALISLLTIPTISNLPLPKSLAVMGVGEVAAILGLISIFGYLISELLGRWLSIFRQLGRFAIVGILNTVLDFAILNLLITTSGIAGGVTASLFKGISFLIAVTNSYYWNKYWTFEFKAKVNREFLQFFIVSLIGFGFNVGAFSLVVNTITPMGNINPEAWANVGALAGTLTGLAWNFVGYKFIVFKKRLI